MTSFNSPSLSCPYPGPPRSSSRKIAHSPWSLIWSWSPLTIALIFGFGVRTAYGKTSSSGSTSSRQNSSTQSSFFWNSGSVEKSQAIWLHPVIDVVGRQSVARDRAIAVLDSRYFLDNTSFREHAEGRSDHRRRPD